MRALVVSEEGAATPLGDAELDAATGRVAAGLAGRGVKPGDVVAVQLPKGILWLAVLRAIWQLGAVSLPCPELLSEADVSERVDRSGAVLALLAEGDVPQADGFAPRHAGDPNDPAFLLFTSGTEGGPKGALHRRSYLVANRLQSERWMGIRPGDRVWCTAATGWSKSLRNVWMAAELCGAEAVLHRGRFDADQRLALIAELRPDVLCMSPTEYRALRLGSRLREPTAGGARGGGRRRGTGRRHGRALARCVRHHRARRLRPDETGAVTGVLAATTTLPARWAARFPGSRWRSRTGSSASCRQLCQRSSPGTGTTPARPPHPCATACGTPAIWSAGTRTGTLRYEGRRDDVISSSGYRIGPGEVEAALRGHPAVVEAAAVGLPDPERGQIVHADVVLADGVAGSDELADALRAHVRGVTAAYKYPRSIRFVAELPHTATGKLQRSEVRRSLCAAGGSADRA